MNSLTGIVTWLRERRFVLAILLAIVLALALTSVSMWVYHINDISRIDISRPGYEDARKSVERENGTVSSFESTGQLDEKSLDIFQKEFLEKREQLDGNSRFDPQIISDEQLKLGPADSTPSS